LKQWKRGVNIDTTMQIIYIIDMFKDKTVAEKKIRSSIRGTMTK